MSRVFSSGKGGGFLGGETGVLMIDSNACVGPHV